VFDGPWQTWAGTNSAVFTYAFGKLDNTQRDAFFLTNVPNWDASWWLPRHGARSSTPAPAPKLNAHFAEIVASQIALTIPV
jgi:hypothetical protein